MKTVPETFDAFRTWFEKLPISRRFAMRRAAGCSVAYEGAEHLANVRLAAARVGLPPTATLEEVLFVRHGGQAVGCPCQQAAADRPVAGGGGPWLPSRRGLCVAQLVPVDDIETDPARFQNRTDAFSELSAQKVADDYDPNKFDPIVIWRDPARGRFFVLSGHSRLEGMKRRHASHVPAREFEGTEAEAIQFARVDANRAATAESLIEDLAAYRLMRDGDPVRELKPAKRAELSRAFPGKAAKLEAWSHLNPGGLFVQALGADNRSEFPYLESRATWVGNFRKEYGADFSNTYEDDCFRFFYSDARNLKLAHKDFTEELEKRLAWGRERLFPECDGQQCTELEELSKRGPQREAYAELEKLQRIKSTIQERLKTTDRGARVYTDSERERLLEIGREIDQEIKRLRRDLNQAEAAPSLFGIRRAGRSRRG